MALSVICLCLLPLPHLLYLSFFRSVPFREGLSDERGCRGSHKGAHGWHRREVTWAKSNGKWKQINHWDSLLYTLSCLYQSSRVCSAVHLEVWMWLVDKSMQLYNIHAWWYFRRICPRLSNSNSYCRATIEAQICHFGAWIMCKHLLHFWIISTFIQALVTIISLDSPVECEPRAGRAEAWFFWDAFSQH